MKHLLSILAATLLATAAGLGLGATLKEASAAGGHVETCGGGSIYLSDYEKRTLDLHNRARARNGLARFCVHPALVKSARSHSQEMIDKDYFSHDSYDGESFGARLERFGYYPYLSIAENITSGRGSGGDPDSIFDVWMASSVVRSETEIGVGTAYGRYKGSSGMTMYTVVFGTRFSVAPAPEKGRNPEGPRP
jgi:uncharacterized protein YkwD